MYKKEYILMLRHNEGKHTLRIGANSEEHAIKRICESESCPERAVIKIEPVLYYVTMTDRFFSRIYKTTNKVIVICETLADANRVYHVALERSDMKYVNIAYNEPRYPSHYRVDWYKSNPEVKHSLY